MIALIDITEDAIASVWPVVGAKSARLELPVQIAFRKLVKDRFRGVRVVAIPNAGKRGPAAIRQAKAEGLKSGFPDTICIWATGVAFIEFKRGDATPCSVDIDQREWLDWLRDAGFHCAVFRHETDAVEWLRQVGAPMA